jgi:hypothetical protein
MAISPHDAVYPVTKIALVLDALAAEGIAKEDALRRLNLSQASISSPASRVSLDQVIDCYGYAAECALAPHFAFRTGLRFHVSAYGMYGFAILSTVNFRETMQFAVKYHQLAAPLTTMEFTEIDGCGVWRVEPLAHPRIDARLFKFIIEMQFGIILSLHRDIMGPSFSRQRISGHFPFDSQRFGVCGPVRGASSVRTISEQAAVRFPLARWHAEPRQ